jgi:hypothetical protein
MSNQTERVDQLAAALRYACQGVPVFPLAPRSKFPLISAANGGRGLHDATTDAARIQAWWMAHPTANAGLRTGVAFDVIDLDSEAAVDALEASRAGRERITGPPLWQRRRTGSTTSSHPQVLAISRDCFQVWTSAVRVVTWLRRPASIRSSLPLDHPRQDQSCTVVAGRADQPSARHTSNAPRLTSRSRSAAYGNAALRRTLERLAQSPNGTRNDSLNGAAFALGQLVAEGALDEVETTAALTQAGRDLGLGLNECERTVASGLSAGMEQPRGMAIGQ